jgi:hypothetical protein
MKSRETAVHAPFFIVSRRKKSRQAGKARAAAQWAQKRHNPIVADFSPK